jgi:hypothetical protein
MKSTQLCFELSFLVDEKRLNRREKCDFFKLKMGENFRDCHLHFVVEMASIQPVSSISIV